MVELNKATRKDVAKLADVSETIVSYVLNNNRYVAEEKRERVLHAVKELNYKPNSIARALKGKRSNHLLFIADKISNEHFGILVEEMDKIAYAQGYLISLMANRNSKEFVSQVISRQPDGIIVSSVSFQEQYLQMLVDSRIPVVLIGNRVYEHLDERVGTVSPGVMEGIREGVLLLIAKGRQNIIYIDRISASGNFGSMSDLRYRGFCEQMQESSLPFSRDSIFSGYCSEEELSAALVHRIRSGAKIDGVIARNDNLASVALSAITECGLKIPADISIVGFDNSRISKITTPKLTTVQIDRSGMACGIITMMNSMIAGNAPTTISFQTTLIEREST